MELQLDRRGKVSTGRMKQTNAIFTILSLIIGIVGIELPAVSAAMTQSADSSQSAIAKRIGPIKAISGSALTLGADSGPDISVSVEPNARILRMAPGDKDLKNASSISIADLKVGDTVRVRGHASANGIDALEVLVITSSALDAVRDQIRQDWQKRGIGGLVDSVDPATGNITVSIPRLSGKKSFVVHTAKNTVIKRYAADSFKYEDAKPSTLQEIQPGDQLNARGDRSPDGSEVTAEEIVTGVFPRFAGTIKSVDLNTGMLSVQDLLSKKNVQVKITADSQLHRIPTEIAQGLAMRLKSALPPGTPGAAGTQPKVAPALPSGNGQAAPAGAASGGIGARPAGAGTRSAGDFQQMLARLPSSTLADLHLQKGDAVVILGTGGSPSTAITLLSGVEPILQAAPSASQAMMLTPWSLGGAPGGDSQ
jgi:transcription antitermination factor NusG